MADRTLLDTDIFVDHIQGQRRLPKHASYSVVTRCELLAGPERDEPAVFAMLAAFDEIAVDRAIAERAGRLRRGSRIRTPDALIAATALEHGLSLVTRNRRDFENVHGLHVLDPQDLAT